MKTLLRYLRAFTWGLLALLILVSIQVYTSLSLPDYMARIINEGIAGQSTHTILVIGGEMLLLSLLGGVCMVGVGFLGSRIATGFAKTVREKLFQKTESFSLAEFNSFSTASLITRSTNDIQQVQQVLVMILRLAVMAPLTGIGAIIKAYHTAPSMTYIMVIAVIIMVIIIVTIFGLAIPRFQKLQDLVDRLNLVSREILTGLRVIRAFNTEEAEEKKFARANTDITKANLYVNRLMVLLQPSMTIIMNLTVISIVWVGAQLISANTLSIGEMLAFMQYAMQAIFAFLMLSIVFIMIPRAAVSWNRINEVLTTEPIIVNPKKAIKPEKGFGRISFNNVSFEYAGAEAPALHNISFTAEPDQVTAIVGSTGSGKSTIISLIPRFYDVTEGSVQLDGVDVRNWNLDDLYDTIGFVPQKAVLFSGTVEDTVTYGAPESSEDAVKKALDIAQASEFVNELPEKYNAPISQGGSNLSGGQKQRLSIARAIARKPEMYIFDDCFSALDFRTDAALRRALQTETKGKTVLIVAQRISTIRDADKIIVLNEGRIVGEGTHEVLLKKSDVYREIATSQLTEKELL